MDLVEKNANEFITSVEALCIVNEKSIYQYVTLSLGYASYQRSDTLYQAKRNGRNQKVNYELRLVI